MELVGGDVSLDLVNTGSGEPGRSADKLRGYDDLVTWARRVELVGEERAERLRRVASTDHVGAAAALERARALRDVIYRLFAGEAPRAEDVEALGRAAAEAAAARRLEPTPDGYALVWPASDDLDQILWPVALSATELLTSDDRHRVKQCASETCDWLFLDQSRNRSRRWCDMRECGNRAKARRFQARQRGPKQRKA
jgi:predicted RNA-binding Zn ribbon-like protein